MQTVILERMESNKMSPVIDSAYFLEITSKPQHRQGGLGQGGARAQGNLSELKRQSWVSRGANVARVRRAEKHWRSVKRLPLVFNEN